MKLEGISLVLGRTPILTNLSMEIAPREVTALVGPSGSGKTTLLAAIAGEVAFEKGDIHFLEAGQNVARPRFSWIPQAASVLGDRTTRDNVALGALSRGATLAHAAHLAELHLNQVGLGHRIDLRARLLSGGEQQRLAFARALASAAPLILADEPTANLDDGNTGRICNMLRDLSGSSTILVATHDPRVTAACARSVHLRDDP